MVYKAIISNSSAVLKPFPKGTSTELALLKFAEKLYPEKILDRDEK